MKQTNKQVSLSLLLLLLLLSQLQGAYYTYYSIIGTSVVYPRDLGKVEHWRASLQALSLLSVNVEVFRRACCSRQSKSLHLRTYPNRSGVFDDYQTERKCEQISTSVLLAALF